MGLAAGVLGAKEVLLTDLPYALPNMRANVECHKDLWTKTGCEQILCHNCDWYDPPSLQELGAVMMMSSLDEIHKNIRMQKKKRPELLGNQISY